MHALLPRYLNNYYLSRGIDLLGLWHNHDLYRIYNYILSEELNTIPSIEYSIGEFIIKQETLTNESIWLEIGISEIYKYTDNIDNNHKIINNIIISLLHINYNSYNETTNILNILKKI